MERVPLWLFVAEWDGVPDLDWLRVADSDCVPVRLGVRLILGVSVGERVPDCDAVDVCEMERVPLWLLVAVGEGVPDLVWLRVEECEGVPVRLGVRLVLGVSVGERVPDCDAVDVCEMERVPLWLRVLDEDGVLDAVWLFVADCDRVEVPDIDRVMLWLLVPEDEGVICASANRGSKARTMPIANTRIFIIMRSDRRQPGYTRGKPRMG